jgi:threonyl-tRNA synthetase
MCTPDQLESEFKSCLVLAIYMLKTLGLYEDASYRFSQWDPDNRAKYIGTDEQWNEAQGIMKNILDNLGVPYEVGVGEAAFYGPKLDIQIRNVWGKEDTLITIQIDQLLAEKFGMEYTDSDGAKKNPYIIHRTSIGCYERTLAYLIEKYAGAFPTWLAPTQVKVITVSEKNNEYALKVAEELSNCGIRVEADTDNESVGKKIRNAVLEKVPYILVLGDKEMAEGSVAVRKRGSQETVAMSIAEFKAEILNNIASKSLTL